MDKARRYAPEVRERAVRLVQEHEREYPSQWAAIRSIAEKMGCTREALRRWIRRAEVDAGQRPGLTTAEQQRVKELERENRELRRTNEILRKASAFFAQAELDPPRELRVAFVDAQRGEYLRSAIVTGKGTSRLTTSAGR